MESYLTEVELCCVWLYFNVGSAYPPGSPGPPSPPGPHHHTNLDSVFPGLQNGSSVHSIGGEPRSTVCHCLLLMPFLRSNHTGIRPAQGSQSYVSHPLLKAHLPNILWLTFFFFRFLLKSYFLCETWEGGRGQTKSCIFPLCVS